MELKEKVLNIHKYKVNMDIVRRHDCASPYLKLVRREIRNGGGFVSVIGEPENGMAWVYAYDTYSYLSGGVRIPRAALY